jgi:ribosome biogenesis protein Tsr3
VERVRMNNIEACVAKLERIVSRNEEKTNEFIKNLSAFMGGVKQFMKLQSETLTYYREQKLATRVETLEKTVGK